MKADINHPALSKINWLAFLIALVNMGAAMGYIPADYQVATLGLVNSSGPALIMIARTWFTAP